MTNFLISKYLLLVVVVDVAGLTAESLSEKMKIRRFMVQSESTSPPDDEAAADVEGLAAESLSRRMNS